MRQVLSYHATYPHDPWINTFDVLTALMVLFLRKIKAFNFGMYFHKPFSVKHIQ